MQFVERSCILFYYGNERFILQELKNIYVTAYNIWLTVTQAPFILLKKLNRSNKTVAMN